MKKLKVIITIITLSVVCTGLLLGFTFKNHANADNILASQSIEKIKKNTKEKLAKIIKSQSIDLNKMKLTTEKDSERGIYICNMSDNSFEINANANDTVFTLTDVKAREIKTNGDHDVFKSFSQVSKDNNEKYAEEIANVLDNW